MKCPNCDETLLMTHRNNIEIDYCPSCRGVWLDRGELDKMLDYAASQNAPIAGREHRPYTGDCQRHDPEYKSHKPHKRKSLLGELFDFD